jgi:3-oxosteroid 1-dehydrogenase
MAALPERWDLEVDLVAVGSGLGGVTAAIVAHDRGQQVALLEKAPRLGGVAGYGGGEVFLPNNYKLRAAGIEDSDAAGREYLRFLAAGFADEELQETLLQTAHEAVEYMGNQAGVRWLAVEGLCDYYYPHAPGTHPGGRYLSVELFKGAELGEWQQRSYTMTPIVPPILHAELYAFGGLAKVTEWDYELLAQRITDDVRAVGPGLMGWFLKAALIDRAIPAFVETPARELVSDAGRVIGVRAEREGAPFFVRARRGVVLATGGYDLHRELARYYEGVPDWNSSCPPFLDGDGLVMGSELGAAVAGVPPTNLGMFFGYNIPGEEHDGRPLYRTSWEGGVPHAIWINRAGRRFCDESFYKEFQPRVRHWDGRTQTQPNYPPFLIFDTSYRERYPVGSFMPGQTLPDELVVQADTLVELAGRLGIDGAELERTVERYNRMCSLGSDEDFGRGSYPWANRMFGDPSYKNPNMGPLTKPPYHGMRLVPVSVGINSHGLKTNRSAQVVHVRGHAIPGLYAVGNAAALLDLGGGYQSGTSNLRGIVWGYIAGLHASQG